MGLPAGAYEDAVDAIGNTPLIRLNRITSRLRNSEIWVKLERCNPGGSIKDRIGLWMVLDAEEKGLLKPGGTIIEATSGNTGIGLAMVAAQRGYHCIFTIPDKMSNEKIDLLRAIGAEVHVCPTAVAKDDQRSYYQVAARLSCEISGAWYPDQYSHPSNPLAHVRSTGPEIWRQCPGITHFVATMGTGGTITGCAAALHEAARKEGKIVKCILAHCWESKSVFAHVVPCSGCTTESKHIEDVVSSDVAWLGYSRLLLKSDNEPGLVNLVKAALLKIKCEVGVDQASREHSFEYDSRSNGGTEIGIRNVRGLFRTLKLCLEKRIGHKIPAHHPLTSWLLEHTAMLMSSQVVGPDGRTPWRTVRGRDFGMTNFAFCEKVMLARPD